MAALCFIQVSRILHVANVCLNWLDLQRVELFTIRRKKMLNPVFIVHGAIWNRSVPCASAVLAHLYVMPPVSLHFPFVLFFLFHLESIDLNNLA